MLAWLSKLYSDDTSASFGRVISTLSFLVMIALHLVILVNPHGWFTNFSFVKQLTDYLFYLTIGGYSAAVIKEIAHVIFAKLSPAGSIDKPGEQ